MRVRGVICPTVVLAVVGWLFVAPTPPASADVLHVPPEAEVCRGASFEVGVWYQEYSGGSRKFRIKAVAPSGKTVFRKKGKASADHYKQWRIKTQRVGTYRVVYRGPKWVTRYRVKSVRC